jgi:hypothetical protein
VIPELLFFGKLEGQEEVPCFMSTVLEAFGWDIHGIVFGFEHTYCLGTPDILSFGSLGHIQSGIGTPDCPGGIQVPVIKKSVSEGENWSNQY